MPKNIRTEDSSIHNFTWSSRSAFNAAKKHFPFSCVDLVVLIEEGVILVKRENQPYKGLWHLPGGIIHRGQTMSQKAEEVAYRELGCKVDVLGFIGVFENLHTYRHDISHCFLAKLHDRQQFASTNLVKVFKQIPTDTIPYHKKIIEHAKTIHFESR